jgi:dihydropyrimidinase
LSGEEFGINTFSMSMAGENMLNDQDLHRGLEYCAEVGCLAQVHAESGEIIERNTKRMQENGVTGPEGFGNLK